MFCLLTVMSLAASPVLCGITEFPGNSATVSGHFRPAQRRLSGEGIFKELPETLLRNTFTPIEWEGFTPYAELPPRLIARRKFPAMGSLRSSPVRDSSDPCQRWAASSTSRWKYSVVGGRNCATQARLGRVAAFIGSEMVRLLEQVLSYSHAKSFSLACSLWLRNRKYGMWSIDASPSSSNSSALTRPVTSASRSLTVASSARSTHRLTIRS